MRRADWEPGRKGSEVRAGEMVSPKLITCYKEKGLVTSKHSSALVLATFQSGKKDPHLPMYPVIN